MKGKTEKEVSSDLKTLIIRVTYVFSGKSRIRKGRDAGQRPGAITSAQSLQREQTH